MAETLRHDTDIRKADAAARYANALASEPPNFLISPSAEAESADMSVGADDAVAGCFWVAVAAECAPDRAPGARVSAHARNISVRCDFSARDVPHGAVDFF